MFNLFFNGNFVDMINKLEIPSFYDLISTFDVNNIRDYSKSVLKEHPQESATRVFRDLILLNPLIPIERRAVHGLKMRSVFKIWHMMDEKLNIDLLLNVTEVIDRLVMEYAGIEYSNEYIDHLEKRFKLIFPIDHDHLKLLTMLYLYTGKRSGKTPLMSAFDLYKEEILVNAKTYSKYFTSEGIEMMGVFAKEFSNYKNI